jgi:hypothetical protein
MTKRPTPRAPRPTAPSGYSSEETLEPPSGVRPKEQRLDADCPPDHTFLDGTVQAVMGRRIPSFGQVDFGDQADLAPRFGEIDLGLDESEDATRIGRVDPKLLDDAQESPADGESRTSISSLSAHIASFVARPAAVGDARVPRVVVPMDQITRLPIDHRAGFLLAHIDGTQTMEEILDVCPMPRSEALDLIAELASLGVLAIN